jgi:hypothetical protein
MSRRWIANITLDKKVRLLFPVMLVLSQAGCSASTEPRLVVTGDKEAAPLRREYWYRLEYRGQTGDRYVDACAYVGSATVTVLVDFDGFLTDSRGKPVTVFLGEGQPNADAGNLQVESALELWSLDCRRGVGDFSTMFRCSDPMAGGVCDIHINDAFPDPDLYWKAPEVPALCAFLNSERKIPAECEK